MIVKWILTQYYIREFVFKYFYQTFDNSRCNLFIYFIFSF